MKKNIVLMTLVVFSVFTSVGLAENIKDNQRVLLRWKVTETTPVAYTTSLSNIKSNNLKINYDEVEKTKDSFTVPKELKESICNHKIPEIGSLTTLLTKNTSGNIDVKMVVNKFNGTEDSETEPLQKMAIVFMKQMEGKVTFRSEITESGNIVPFYLAGIQKNNLTIFFELPNKPVQVGDTWSIDVNLIAFDASLLCKKAYRVNRVKLVSLDKNEKGNTIALLEYFIVEYVEGTHFSPVDSSEDSAQMNVSFIGYGQLNVDNGSWEKFNGELSISSPKFKINTTQLYALQPLKEVPKELLNLK